VREPKEIIWGCDEAKSVGEFELRGPKKKGVRRSGTRDVGIGDNKKDKREKVEKKVSKKLRRGSKRTKRKATNWRVG